MRVLRLFDFSTCLVGPPPTSTLFPYTTLFRSSARPRSRAPTSCGGRRSSACALSLPIWRNRAQADERRPRSEEHTSELQSLRHLVCRLLHEKKNIHIKTQERDIICAGNNTARV